MSPPSPPLLEYLLLERPKKSVEGGEGGGQDLGGKGSLSRHTHVVTLHRHHLF